MRKYIITSSVYAALGLLGGVFYREFTKMKEFEGITALGRVHPHLLGLGMLFFLVIGLIAVKLELEKYKTYKAFFCVYNTGLAITTIMLLIRGILEVNKTELSTSTDKLIATFGGIGHIILAVGIVLLFIALFKATKKNKEEVKA